MEREFNTKDLQYVSIKKRKADEEIPPVLVADSLCGSGKTQAAIEYINTSPRWAKFLYVTPYLEEIERIKESCPEAKFKAPDLIRGKGSKMRDFQELFDRGENIVCTHALFRMFTPDNFKIASAYGYTLIMDEVADVVSKYECETADLYTILNPKYNYVTVDEETNQINLSKEKDFFENNFSQKQLKQIWGDNGLDLLEKIKNGCVYLYDTTWKTLKEFYKNGGEVQNFTTTLLMWSFPVGIFKSFEKVLILTYMFDGQYQANYYKYFNIPFKYIHTEKLPVIDINTGAPRYQYIDAVFDKPQIADYKYLKERIEICEKPKLNALGDFEYFSKGVKKSALCKTWYNNVLLSADKEIAKQMTNNTYNYFYNICKQKNSADLIWTTFKDYQKLLKKSPFSKEDCFVSCTARATNKFKERHYCAYLINIYADPFVKKFFAYRNVEMDEDIFALSELIQWLFRSAIRKGDKIYVYIPSQRMRELLQVWLDGNFIYW